jgi:diacylglycerol O-acyltransferase
MVTRINARKVALKVGDNVKDALSGTLGLSGERMSKVDTAWLRMDSPSNLMMIVGVWVLQAGHHLRGPVPAGAERLLKYPRFGQRVVQDAAGATWVRDTDFDIHRHVVIEKLRAQARGREQEALQDRLAELP